MNAPLPILYSFRRCPYAMRARLALDVSNQLCDVREVSLRNKPEEMLRASPKGTVPVLIDTDGTVFDQSLDIMLWALRRHDPEHWLAPETNQLDAMMELIRHFDDTFKWHLDRYKYPNRFADANAELSRSEAMASLFLIEAKLQSSPFLFGSHITLADMATIPFVRQFSKVEHQWFANQPIPYMHRWLNAILNSPRFVRIMRTAKPETPLHP